MSLAMICVLQMKADPPSKHILVAVHSKLLEFGAVSDAEELIKNLVHDAEKKSGTVTIQEATQYCAVVRAMLDCRNPPTFFAGVAERVSLAAHHSCAQLMCSC